ncbi:hypothetical protein ACFV23_07815 [Streptomyces sp. NPDC059627]
MESGDEIAMVVGADSEHRRETDRGVHRVAPADPVPEAEHVRGVDAELGELAQVAPGDLGVMARERLPRRTLAQRGRWHGLLL